MAEQQWCYQRFDHEGGRPWCILPAGHAEPHYPDINDASFKRRRLAPKRFNPEQAALRLITREKGVKQKIARLSKGKGEACGSANSPERAPPRAPRPLDGKAKERGAAAAAADREGPNGYVSSKSMAAKRQQAGEGFEAMQLKLSEAMRRAGWLVLPRHGKGKETGHFIYVWQTPLAEACGHDEGQAPYFSSAPAAVRWWVRMKGKRPLSEAAKEEAEHEERAVVSEGTWLSDGALVETEVPEPGLFESRYAAKLLQVDVDRALVEVAAFTTDSGDGPLQVWVDVGQVSPPPPPAPPDYFEVVCEAADEAPATPVRLELFHEGGWWGCVLKDSRCSAEGRLELLVHSERYGSERWAGVDCVRPRWRFLGTAWLAERYGLVFADVEPAAAAPSAGSASCKAPLPLHARGYPAYESDSQAGSACGSSASRGGSPWHSDVGEGGKAEGRQTDVVLETCDEAALQSRLEEAHAQLSSELALVEQARAAAQHNRERAVEITREARRLFSLARSAVQVAGGSLELPVVFRADPPMVP
ncbi:hypothetical protein AB1Y20_016355 [Prymnesium parvum]|uniref:Uncharacterized protein n=1 Tax=Prymnesium parvum TaxID=97485 RepID=A0AB34IG07_PRYPA